jgi:hypothetical protein
VLAEERELGAERGREVADQGAQERVADDARRPAGEAAQEVALASGRRRRRGAGRIGFGWGCGRQARESYPRGACRRSLWTGGTRRARYRVFSATPRGSVNVG